ncbi:MAG: SPOR domain-containing protein [Rikenellaceae bacterium]|nr:SPOR domain-containing protein [Rikenellaceae bacterium]
MKKIILSILLFITSSLLVYSQEIETTKDTTVISIKPPLLDSTLLNRNIFSILKEAGPSMNRVTIEQSSNIEALLHRHVTNSAGRKITGYRVRIFFDNKQDARNRSEAVAGQFASQFPEIRVYSTYEKPFFKVTVGDFRTKSEAMQLLRKIEGEYRSVFLVKETINYPAI